MYSKKEGEDEACTGVAYSGNQRSVFKKLFLDKMESVPLNYRLRAHANICE